jgi:hypothetical protein
VAAAQRRRTKRRPKGVRFSEWLGRAGAPRVGDTRRAIARSARTRDPSSCPRAKRADRSLSRLEARRKRGDAGTSKRPDGARTGEASRGRTAKDVMEAREAEPGGDVAGRRPWPIGSEAPERSACGAGLLGGKARAGRRSAEKRPEGGRSVRCPPWSHRPNEVELSGERSESTAVRG